VVVPEVEIFFDSFPPAELLVFVNKSVSFQIVAHTDPATKIFYTLKTDPILDTNSVSISGSNVPVNMNTYEKNDIVTVKVGTGLTRENFLFGGWGLNPSVTIL